MASSSDEWLPFLEANGGVAPDLPGFGRSGKPGHFPYSLEGYADFLDAFTAHAGLDRVDLVMHDWGAVGLAWAARRPERVGRLVLIAPAPLPPEIPWGRTLRLLSRPVAGEIAMGAVYKPVFARVLRRRAGRPLPAAFLDHLWRCFDPGTQRAILRLLRATDPAARESLASALDRIRRPALLACPATVSQTGPAVVDAYGGHLTGAAVEVLQGVGHLWPWLDRTDVGARVSLFLQSGIGPPGLKSL
jgi:pimeloyl-ACP methyl ester carboxylesterase